MERFYPNKTLSGWLGKASRIWQKLFVQTIIIPEQSAPSGNPDSDTGWLYCKDSGGASRLYFEDDAGTVTDLIAAGTGGVTLDGAYDYGGAGVGNSITVDQGAVTLNGSHATNDTFFVNKTTGSGDAIQVTNAGTGKDINGTSSLWYVDKTGAATFVSATISGTITANTISGASMGGATVTGGLNLNDGVGASPNLTFTDGTGQTAVFNKGDTTALTLTTTATGGLKVVTGNLWVGDGSPGTAAMDGDDLYVKGASEFDGAVQFDGAVTMGAAFTQSGGAVNLNVSSNNAVNIGTGTTTAAVTIGGAGTQTISVGNGAAAKTVNLGSSNTTSTTTILSGSGGVLINNSNNQPTTINGGTSSGTLTLGGASATVTGVGTWTINHDAAAVTTGIGTGTTTGTVTIGGAGAQTLEIGTGAAAKTVNVGSTNTTSTTTINSGSGGILLNKNNNQPTEIGTGTTTGAITIGGAGAQTISVGSGAAAKTVTVGSTNTTSTTTINAGSGKINLVGAVAGNGASALTGMLVSVDNDADGKAGGDITVAMSGSTFTNALAGGAAAWVLPPAAAGLEYTFVVMAAQELRITPAAGDQINVGGSAGAAAEYFYSSTVGHSITLTAVDGTNWIAKSYTGTWAQQTP